MNDVQKKDARKREYFGWIDAAKGVTIVLVVILYASEWAQVDVGAHIWLQHVVDFAAPFRMPAFFLISGLLLSSPIQRDWRTFLDAKVMHYAYFYLLWLTILITFEAPWIVARGGWLEVADVYVRSFVRPYSMLWFIYLLPIFFVATKFLRTTPAAMIWTVAAVLQIVQPETGIKVLEKFIAYYVFFYSGYVLAPRIFLLARLTAANRPVAIAAIAAWAIINAIAVDTAFVLAPGVELLFGMLGAVALIAGCTLLAATRAGVPLAYCGRQSLVIYLGFYIPLVIVGKIALDTGWIGGPGGAATLAAVAGVLAPLVLRRLVQGTPAAFLFQRPSWFSLSRVRRVSLEVSPRS